MRGTTAAQTKESASVHELYMWVQQKNIAIVVALAIGAAVLVFFLPPVTQDPAYHQFADRRGFVGLANFFNVISNLPYLLIGLWGFVKNRDAATRTMAAGIFATGLGSAWYHSAPSNATLVWDRLPMTIVFMSLLAIVLGRRSLLAPLIAAGIASIAWWRYTGDLRLYGLIQFFPILAILVLTVGRPESRNLILAVVWYVTAKICEFCDPSVFQMTHEIVSGHTVKHLASALSAVYLLLYIKRTYPYVKCQGERI